MLRRRTRSMTPDSARRRPARLISLAFGLIAITACASDAGDETLPEITLLPSTAPLVSTTAPPATTAAPTTSTPTTDVAGTNDDTAADGDTERDGDEPDADESGTTEPGDDTAADDAPAESTASSDDGGSDAGDGSGSDGAAPGSVSDRAREALLLTERGLGDVGFGATPDGVIDFVSAMLEQQPTSDTGWVDPFTIGTCFGEELRIVTWGSLALTFGDVSTVLEGQRHFYAYSYGFDGEVGTPPLGLQTPEGVTVGSRLVDLLAAYPTLTLNPEDDFLSANFVVSDNLRGFLTGLGDTDLVTVILGGVGCGEQ